MGSRPYFHILLFFFILSVKFDSLMSDKPKNKPSICERRTISFDADMYLLAQRRMKEEGETMFSRYVQTLVRRDTAELRAQALNSEKSTQRSQGKTKGKAASPGHADADDKIIIPEELYPNGLPPEMRMAFEAEMRRLAAATKTEAKADSKKGAHSASKKLPKKTA